MNSLSQDKRIANSSIQAVTVYPGSAKVTRLSTIELSAGDNNIIINNLPLNLDKSSLRVSGEAQGEGSISLGSVQLSKEYQIEVVQEKEKQLRDQIEEINENRKIIEDSITRNQSQLSYINKIALGTNDKKNDNGSYQNLPLDQWQLAWQTLNDSTESVQEKIREANKAIKQNDTLLLKLSKELKDIASNQKERRIASLHIESDSETTLDLTITYQIRGASWDPVYDADLNTETGSIELKSLAQISQRTGEDWNNVDITLSTLRPSAGTQLPELNPWVLDFLPDLKSRSYDEILSDDSPPLTAERNRKTIDVSMAVESDDLDLEEVTEANHKRRSVSIVHQESDLVSTDFSAEFNVPGTIDLQSGSDRRRFALNTQKIDSTIKLASAPRLDPRVMLVATTKHEEETPLLEGHLSLYRDGNFVGNSFLDQKLSGEEITLSFGEDDKVKINFLPHPDKKRKNGLLFGKKKVVERYYKVNINSNHNKEFPITISDVLPIPSDENIKVINLGEKPTHTDVDDKEGVVCWDKTLEAKESVAISYGYSVSYPEDRSVEGL